MCVCVCSELSGKAAAAVAAAVDVVVVVLPADGTATKAREKSEKVMCCVVLCVCVPKSNSRAAVAVVAAGRRKINCRSGSCHCHCRLQSYRGHCVVHSLRLSTPPNWPLNQVAFVFFAVPIDTAKCVLALGARVFVVLFVMFSCRNSRSSKKSPLIAPLLSLSTSTWIHFVLLYLFPSFSFCVMLKINFSVLFWTIRSKKKGKMNVCTDDTAQKSHYQHSCGNYIELLMLMFLLWFFILF